MLEFSVNDPFPLINLESISYSEILRHSQAVDQWLGFEFEKIEQTLMAHGCRARPTHASHEHQQLWFGLAVQSLLTPYVELRDLLGKLRPQPGQIVIDLGAAYARLAFVIERHHPGVHFLGYEYVGERVHEARRVLDRASQRGTAKSSLEVRHGDLTAPDFRLPAADFYFIYDYGTPKAIEKTLYDLRRMSDFVLIARGRHCRMLIESRHPWLVPAFPGEQEGRVTIYRAASCNSAVTTSAGPARAPLLR